MKVSRYDPKLNPGQIESIVKRVLTDALGKKLTNG